VSPHRASTPPTASSACGFHPRVPSTCERPTLPCRRTSYAMCRMSNVASLIPCLRHNSNRDARLVLLHSFSTLMICSSLNRPSDCCPYSSAEVALLVAARHHHGFRSRRLYQPYRRIRDTIEAHRLSRQNYLFRTAGRGVCGPRQHSDRRSVVERRAAGARQSLRGACAK
jgi:hypothetical protein